MKPVIALLACLLLAASAHPQGCNLPNCHDLGSVSVWDGNGGPFLTGHTYILQVMTVPAGQTLTIQPGAIVKFKINGLYRADVSGTLHVQGTAAQPVIITSYRDDVGGDHNGDGAATTPAPGNWSGMRFFSSSTDCDLDWCEIRYSKNAITAYGPTAVPIDLRHVTTAHAAQAGFHSYDARPGVVDACAFDDGDVPVRNLRYYEVQSFTNCTASGNTKGDDLGLTIFVSSTTWYGSISWTPVNTLNGTGVIMVKPNVTLHATATLTLGAGMIIKMRGGNEFAINGELHCNGSAAAPVIFTSVADDTAGGDSENDGPTSGTAGDWARINFLAGSDASTLTWAEVRFASVGVLTPSADITLANCRFADCSSFGLQVSAGTTVTNCAFDGNAQAIDPVPITYLANFSGNTASGNAGGDVMGLGTGSLGTTATLSPASSFNATGTFVLRGILTVSGGGTLNINPGVIVKGDPAATSKIKVFGTLHAGAPAAPPVVFTSFLDDSHGGDSNGDGAATSPAPGDWDGLRFLSTADASTLDNVLVRYAGRGGSSSVAVLSCDMTIDTLTVDFGAGAGLDGSGSLMALTNSAFNSCATPLTGVSLEALPGIVGCTAQGNAQGDVMHIGDGNIPGTQTLGAANTLNGTGVLVFDASLAVAGDLTVDAGMIIKFSGAAAYGVTASGTLTCNGSAVAPVVFTSVGDDAIGGDSAGDGPTSGSPGDWKSISSAFGSATMTHTHVRFAGGGEMAAVTGGMLALSDCVITKSASAGIDLANDGSNKSVTNCQFSDVRVPIMRATLADLSNLSGNSATASTQGDLVEVTLPGVPAASGATIATTNTINGNGVVSLRAPIHLLGPTSIGAGMILRFVSGAAIYSAAASPLQVNGTVANPVVFTSSNDDSFGVPDGDPTAPAKGDWIGLDFKNLAPGDSLVSGAIVRYAGEGGAPAVKLDNADVTFCDLVIRDSLGTALDAGFNSSPVLKHPTFLDNCGAPLDGITWAVLANMTGVTASGNAPATGYANATTITSNAVDGNLVIEKDNYFGDCIVVTVSPALNYPTGTLEFGRGVVVKCLPGVDMNLNGVGATGYEKAVFTSINDDSVAGDTNGDGNATTPAPGDWEGIDVALSPPVTFDGVEHAIVRYADVGIEKAFLARSCRAEYCNTGIHLGLFPTYPYNGSGYNLVAFANTGVGIRGGIVYNATSASNGTYGFDCNKVVYSISWNNGVANYTYTSDKTLNPSGTDVVYSCGTTLTVGPPTGGTLGSPNTNCGSAGWGNIDVDPQFTDLANGDLTLTPGSPVLAYVLQPVPPSILGNTGICKPWGLSGQGYPEPLPETRDCLDGPRPSDHDLGGPGAFLADLGAYEYRPHALAVTGDFALGATTTFAIAGATTPNGIAVYAFGLSGDDLQVPGWGVLLIDAASLIDIRTLPLAVPLSVPIPTLPILAGLEVDVQAIAVPNGQPVGAFTEIFRGRFHY